MYCIHCAVEPAQHFAIIVTSAFNDLIHRWFEFSRCDKYLRKTIRKKDLFSSQFGQLNPHLFESLFRA